MKELFASPVLITVGIITLLQYLLLFLCLPFISIFFYKSNFARKRLKILLILFVTIISILLHLNITDFIKNKEIVYHRATFIGFKYDQEKSGILVGNDLDLDVPIYVYPNSKLEVYLEKNELLISNFSDVYTYKMNSDELKIYNEDSIGFIKNLLGKILD